MKQPENIRKSMNPIENGWGACGGFIHSSIEYSPASQQNTAQVIAKKITLNLYRLVEGFKINSALIKKT